VDGFLTIVNPKKLIKVISEKSACFILKNEYYVRMKIKSVIITLFMTLLSCEFQTNLFDDATTKIDGQAPVIIYHNLPIVNSAPDTFHINLRFSEGLNPDSVNTDSVIIKNNSGTKINNISISYDSNYNEIHITGVTDSNYLTRGSSYTVTLTKDITDIAGNNLEEEFSGSLSIATSPQIPSNTSIWTNNYNNGYRVEVGDRIYIEFNENIIAVVDLNDLLTRISFTPSPSFTDITPSISNNLLILTVGAVNTNADNTCEINLLAGDVRSSADNTNCQAQNVTFTVNIKAVK